MIKLFLILIFTTTVFASELFYYNNGKKIALTPLPETRSLNGREFFKDANGQKLIIDNRIIAKIKNDTTIEAIIQNYSISGYKLISKNIYLLFANDATQAINISNLLSNDKNIEYAHPDFIKQMKRR